jgi:tetratricopeptide (TPR) repeat protein
MTSSELSKTVNKYSVNFVVKDDWTDEEVVKIIFNKQCDWTVEIKSGIPHMRDLQANVIVKNSITKKCLLKGMYVQQGNYSILNGFEGPILMYFMGGEKSPCSCPPEVNSKSYITAQKNVLDELEYWKRANKKIKEKDFQSALAICDTGIVQHPKSSPLYELRGLSKYKLGNYKSAIVDYSKALQFNPKNYRALKGRAESKYKSNNTIGACEDYKNAIKLGYTPETKDEDLLLKTICN